MTDVNVLCTQITEQFSMWIDSASIAYGELTVEVKQAHLLDLAIMLRDQEAFDFKLLLDVCGVDYLHYGLDDWETQSTTESGFSRGVTAKPLRAEPGKPNRFAVVYHFLSLTNNHRLRLRVNIPNGAELMVDSLIDLWPSANWFEREVFCFVAESSRKLMLQQWGGQPGT